MRFIFLLSLLVMFVQNILSQASNTIDFPSSLKSGTDETVYFSHESGFYANPFYVSLQASSSKTDIYFTLDGSEPSIESEQYTEPLYIDSLKSENGLFRAIVIRAQLFEGEEANSEIITKTFFISPLKHKKYSLPVMSLITDPSHLYDSVTGIYVKGVNYDPSNPTWTGNYFMTGREWERPVAIQYFSADGDLVIDQQAGMRIHGGRKRGEAQKSLRLYAREEYGESHFNCQLLPQKKKYKRFVLRTTMGCWNNTIIKDAVAGQVVNGLGLDAMDYQPVIVFINGKYWGIQTIRDYLGQHHLSDRYSVPKDSVNIGMTVINEGSIRFYEQLIDYIDNNNLEEEEAFREVEKMLDIENTLNYYLTEIYLNNYDWPGSNRRWWNASEYRDGALKWLFYDLDGAFNARGGVRNNLLKQATEPTDKWPNPPHSTKLLTTLLENEEFKNRFINRAAFLMNYHLHANRVCAIIDTIKAQYDPEVEEHYKRWGNYTYEKWQSSVNNNLSSFIKQRGKYVEQHIQDKFNLSGTALLDFEEIHKNEGAVYIDKMTIPADSTWGVFFKDVPVSLTAVPQNGFNFSHWENMEDSLANPLIIVLEHDTLIKPVFVPNNEFVAVTINEVMGKNDNFIEDESGDDEDWIELYNAGETDVDLSGYYLTDDLSTPFKWQFDETKSNHTLVPAMGYSLLWADDDVDDGGNHVGFKINSSGETIALIKDYKGFPVIIDSIECSFAYENTTYGRYTDGGQSSYVLYQPTPLGENIFSEQSYSIIINEFMADNDNWYADEYGEFDDWIELYNPNDFPVDISSYFISDDMNNPAKHGLQSLSVANRVIEPHGYLVLFADGDEKQGGNHLRFKLSKNGGDIILSHKIGDVISTINHVKYNKLATDISFGCDVDGSSHYISFYSPTPNQSNDTPPVVHNEAFTKLSIYPTYVDNCFSVKCDGDLGDNTTIIVTDIYGRIVHEEEYAVSELEVNISHVPHGIYFVSFAGDESYYTKIIKN